MRSLSFVLPAVFLLAAMEVRADPTEERCSISGLCELCSEAELETEPACKRYGRRQEFTCTYIDLALARDSAAEQGDDANTSASAVTERQRRLRGAEAAGDGGPTGRRAEAIATPARDAAGFLFAPDERRELRVEYRSCDSTAHDDLVAVLRFLVREIARLVVIAPARRSLPRALPPPPSHVSSSFSSAPRRPRLRLALISAPLCTSIVRLCAARLREVFCAVVGGLAMAGIQRRRSKFQARAGVCSDRRRASRALAVATVPSYGGERAVRCARARPLPAPLSRRVRAYSAYRSAAGAR